MQRRVKIGFGGIRSVKKFEYIEMLEQDIKTESPAKEKLFADVIDCVAIALAGESDDFEVDNKITVKDLYELLEEKAKKERLFCIGPFEAAEIFAEKFGSKFVSPAKRILQSANGVMKLEDFI